MKKEPSEAQLAARAKFAAASKARAAERKAQKEQIEKPTIELPEKTAEEVSGDQDVNDLRRQLAETNETLAILKQAFLNNNNQNPSQNIGVGNNGKLVGEVEKYLVDPENYPSPIPRLQAESRLQPLAFNFNYTLDYDVEVSSYETKTGVNMKEPRFTVTLNRIVLDEQGNQTGKRYRARRMVFHEDPQAALIIARENGIKIEDGQDEKLFLNEMRYLRVRDWLFDVFWPRKPDPEKQVHEEVIGGTIVQVFTVNGEDEKEIDFEKLNTKIRV